MPIYYYIYIVLLSAVFTKHYLQFIEPIGETFSQPYEEFMTRYDKIVD